MADSDIDKLNTVGVARIFYGQQLVFDADKAQRHTIVMKVRGEGDDFVKLYEYVVNVQEVTIDGEVVEIEPRWRPYYCFGDELLHTVHLTFTTYPSPMMAGLFRGCTALEEVYVPGTLTSLPSSTFAGCTSLWRIELPQSLTYMGRQAFMGCTALESIDLPAPLRSIDEEAFKGCTALRTISMGALVTKIEARTFEGCTALEHIVLPHYLTEIGDYAFSGCTSLRIAHLNGLLEKVGRYAFSGAGLDTISMPRSVREVGEWAFSECRNLKTATWLTDAGLPERCFNYAVQLNQVWINDEVESMGNSAMNACVSLQTIKLPGKLRHIGEGCFKSAASLLGVTIPEGVEVIDKMVFEGCLRLSYIIVPRELKRIEMNAFYGAATLAEGNYILDAFGTEPARRVVGLDLRDVAIEYIHPQAFLQSKVWVVNNDEGRRGGHYV